MQSFPPAEPCGRSPLPQSRLNMKSRKVYTVTIIELGEEIFRAIAKCSLIVFPIAISHIYISYSHGPIYPFQKKPSNIHIKNEPWHHIRHNRNIMKVIVIHNS